MTSSVWPVPCGARAISTCCAATSPTPFPCWPRVSMSARPARCTLFLPRVMAYLGYAYALAGRLPEALPLLEQAQALQEQARTTGRGSLALQARIVALLSEAYLLAGRLDEARIECRTCPQPRPDAPGTGQRSLDPAAPRRPRGPGACRPGGSGRLLLCTGPRPGRGAGHAPAPGALPPWPRARCTPDKVSGSRRAPPWLPPSTCTATMEMTFWLPQTEATLAQVESAP